MENVFEKLYGLRGQQILANTNLVKLENPQRRPLASLTHQANLSIPITHLESDKSIVERIISHYTGIAKETLDKLYVQALEQIPGVGIDARELDTAAQTLELMMRQCLAGDAPYCFNLGTVPPTDEPALLGDRFISFEVVLSIVEAPSLASPDRWLPQLSWFVASTVMIRDPERRDEFIRGGVLTRSF